jgi:GT2 family glycosyltransferase
MLACRDLASPSNSAPWLSVVLPTYDGAAYVGAALASVAAQADEGVEVICVDDGSSDDTVRIVRTFSQALDLRVVEGPRKGNWVAGTNQGLRLARGEYVSLLHQDDLWMQGRLRHLRGELAGAPSAALFVHPSLFIDEGGRTLGSWGCPLSARDGLVSQEVFFERLLVQNFLAVPAPLFRREAALQVGGLDESLWYTADWDLWLKLAALAAPVFCPRPLAAFRVHGASQTAARAGETQGFRGQMCTVLDRHLSRLAPGRARAVEAAARFSVEVNASLAAASKDGPIPWHLALRFLALGPGGWRRYLRDARLGERVSARVRARARSARAVPRRQAVQ